jgi:hypothetical protein
VSGPWLKVSDAVDYAKKIAPKIAFAVHDGMLSDAAPFSGNIQKIFEGSEIDFRIIQNYDYITLP